MSTQTQLTAPPGEGDATTDFDARYVAVEESYDRNDAILRAYLQTKIPNAEDIKDVLQELWKKVILHAPFEKIGHLPWLMRKARWMAQDYHRRRQRAGNREAHVENLDTIPSEASVPEPPLSADDTALRERFFDGFPGVVLTERQREVIWLYGRHGFTVSEIADRTQTPSSTVHDWIVRGRNELSNFLNEQ